MPIYVSVMYYICYVSGYKIIELTCLIVKMNLMLTHLHLHISNALAPADDQWILGNYYTVIIELAQDMILSALNARLSDFYLWIKKGLFTVLFRNYFTITIFTLMMLLNILQLLLFGCSFKSLWRPNGCSDLIRDLSHSPTFVLMHCSLSLQFATLWIAGNHST